LLPNSSMATESSWRRRSAAGNRTFAAVGSARTEPHGNRAVAPASYRYPQRSSHSRFWPAMWSLQRPHSRPGGNTRWSVAAREAAVLAVGGLDRVAGDDRGGEEDRADEHRRDDQRHPSRREPDDEGDDERDDGDAEERVADPLAELGESGDAPPAHEDG